jgi:hypothetical protein
LVLQVPLESGKHLSEWTSVGKPSKIDETSADY